MYNLHSNVGKANEELYEVLITFIPFIHEGKIFKFSSQRLRCKAFFPNFHIIMKLPFPFRCF